MLGDLRILATDGELLLDTERSALQALFNMIHRFSIGFDAELHKRTLQRGLLSLIGPGAAAVSGAGELPLDEHAHALVSVPRSGVVARAIRTDVGIDLLCDAGDTDALRSALEDAGAAAVTEAAAECLRVKRGRPRYGIDLDDSVIPQEAGLNDRAVSFTKGCYVGQETVARLFYRGKPNRQLRGLRLSAPADSGDQLRFEDRAVGEPRDRRPVASPWPDRAWRWSAARPRRGRPSRSPTTAASPPRSPSSRSGRHLRGRRLAREPAASYPGARRDRWRRSAARRSRRAERGRPVRRRGRRARAPPAFAPRARPIVRGRGGRGPQSTSRPPTSQNASRRLESTGWAARTSRALHVRCLERATEPIEDHAKPAQPPPQRRGALVLLLGGRRRASGRGRGRAAARGRRPPRGTVVAPRRAVAGRGSDPDPPGTATGSAPSARTRTDTREASGAGHSGAGRTMNPAARPARWRAADPAAARS